MREYTTDLLVEECLTLEPRLQEVADKARRIEYSHDFSFSDAYTELKRAFSQYVGWSAPVDQLSDEQHFDAFMHYIIQLLPTPIN